MRFCPLSTGPLHFVGIGGIGMSGIADILNSLGYKVTGSDQAESANIERLRQKGIAVTIGHKAETVTKGAVLVVSSAIGADNPELLEARSLGLPVVKRAEMLSEIMKLKPSIAVGGTHGKTTTTSLIATLLLTAGLDPTIVSGGIINAYGTNARLGAGDWVVAEADESDGSFVKLPATIGVVTNIEPEHMDFYGHEDKLYQAFLAFMENIPFYGLSVVCGDDARVRTLSRQVTDRRYVTYGVGDDVDVKATMKTFAPEGLVFDVHFSERFFKLCPGYQGPNVLIDLKLPMIGSHNMLNGTAALIVALEAGVAVTDLQKGFDSFQGVKRRFTILGSPQNIMIVDDYAHHPTEIQVVLQGAKDLTSGKVIAVMQPHRYSRLSHFFNDFSMCCQLADEVIITPIYGAGEVPVPGLTHETLAKAISDKMGKTIHTIQNEEQLAPLLERLATGGDTVVCMGAGSISQWAKNLVIKLENSNISQDCADAAHF